MSSASLSQQGSALHRVHFLQVTDDSEMTLCMAQALVDTPASSRAVPLDMIAAWYGKWLHSPPFDIGEWVQLPAVVQLTLPAAALASDRKQCRIRKPVAKGPQGQGGFC
jgi:hypothetical protein